MFGETLVHTCLIHIEGRDYEVAVFSRPGGTHLAKTVFAPWDVIINDGPSLEAALAKHRQILPLAVGSRRVLRQFQGEY
ncbi:hypothetical protein DESUT3_27880 [Desulfuromonas versatilis]|uniref:Uncharacterized protein n=1 Tax=Desulfuromonas versatilis TaxID=2802975 RepID=A0ABN6E2G9_9BACT|nr:hypothetical protein [Desulfuromonas versatilis]BCR05719.1 hypothetical protein DESUT3_27880 [Desulfuromonas versatilis]